MKKNNKKKNLGIQLIALCSLVFNNSCFSSVCLQIEGVAKTVTLGGQVKTLHQKLTLENREMFVVVSHH